ncbi:MAG: SPOR domain-containing protein [Candidatus Omnitrophica bacterium]|nr:SPOR domain-containing protein [Candidatus Omnitrophota bacterium]MDD5592017.1 SPOR domain-containing protein [Candidatus Omnitrophota bacterium]
MLNYGLQLTTYSLRKWVLFIICVLCIVICNSAYALDIDKVKVSFLNGDYKSAISAGEKALANYSGSHSGLEELYYILALSYLKDGNYLRASDIFEILLKEFKNSPFTEGAQVGLGDTYFLRGEYVKAQDYYKELLNVDPRTRFTASLYYRLSQIGFKTGDTQQAKEYLDKLKKNFPSSLEVKLDKELYSLTDIYYTVQVGSFAKASNAGNLRDKLIKRGYDAYTEEAQMNDARVYRVKVGRLKLRSEATQLENRLSGEGYPTKIIP